MTSQYYVTNVNDMWKY